MDMSISSNISGYSTLPATQADIIQLAQIISSESHLLSALPLPASGKAVLMYLNRYKQLSTKGRGLVLASKVRGDLAGFAILRMSSHYKKLYGVENYCESFAVFKKYRMTRLSLKFVEDLVTAVGSHFEFPDFCARIAASNHPMMRLALRAGLERASEQYVCVNPMTGEEKEFLDVIYRAPR